MKGAGSFRSSPAAPEQRNKSTSHDPGKFHSVLRTATAPGAMSPGSMAHPASKLLCQRQHARSWLRSTTSSEASFNRESPSKFLRPHQSRRRPLCLYCIAAGLAHMAGNCSLLQGALRMGFGFHVSSNTFSYFALVNGAPAAQRPQLSLLAWEVFGCQFRRRGPFVLHQQEFYHLILRQPMASPRSRA